MSKCQENKLTTEAQRARRLHRETSFLVRPPIRSPPQRLIQLGERDCTATLAENVIPHHLNTLLRAIQEWLRINAHKQHQRQQWYQQANLARIQISQLRVLRICNLPKYDPLQ